MKSTFSFASFICSAILLIPADLASAEDYRTKAREVTDYAQKTFLNPKTGVYFSNPTEKKPDYIWRQAGQLGTGELRPLRTPSEP